MEMLFLGTSSGTPTRSRNVSGLALRSGGAPHWCLVDCGEGTQHRLLHTSLSLIGLRAVFITHIGDHCYGLPGLLASAGLLNRTAGLVVVGPQPVRQFIEGVMASTQLRLPYPLEFVDVDGLPPAGLLPDLDVSATALSHRVASYAYSFTEREVERKLDVAALKSEGVAAGPAWGQLQQGQDVMLEDGRTLRASDYLLPPRKRRKIIVGGDNDRPELLADAASDADVLVHEATYTDPVLRKVGPSPRHSSARMVGRFASDAGIRNLVLTHFSPRYQATDGATAPEELETEARAAYSGNLFLANDLDRYELDKQGVLSRTATGTPTSLGL